MFSDILNQYNPKDKRSHGILKFFAEDLDEIERIKFVETIFERGSWILPTEISKLSKSKELKEQTEQHFFRIFNDWVNARIDYSESIANSNKHPFVTIKLSFEFSEVILSLSNLDFSDKIMSLFKKFLEQANANYLNTFLDRNYFLIVEEYKINEIEFLFDFFLDFYYQNLTKRSSDFIYNFLNRLAFSDKIYSLSSSFIEKLSKLSTKLNESEYKSDYTLLIALLLIDLIKRKKLDLSMSIYSPLIEETLEALDKGNYDNLDFYRFLKRFNYSFNNYNVKTDANEFFNKINDNLIRLERQNNLQKQGILHHFLQSSYEYFELLLFYLERSSEIESRELLGKFIAFVDQLRNSFSSFLWFDEYLNFNTIKGRVVSKIEKGYEVKIETRYFYEKIKEKQIDLPLSDDFIFKHGFGFLPEYTLNNSNEGKKVYSSLKNINSETLSKQFSQEDENTELQSYFISNLNYSIANKLKVIILIPISDSNPIHNVINKYQLKAFFSFIELFLIDKACHYLNLNSPLPRLKRGLKHLLSPPHFTDNYEIGLTEDSFWEILRKTKPLLYDSIYIRHKNIEKSFKEIQYAFDNNITVSGVISSRAKGGMNVDILGLQGFLPGSQIEDGKVFDYDVYIGQTMKFKIININLDYNFVISHKALFDIESEKRKQEILAQLHKDQILEGKVKNITSYGVFIDLGGGIDGLIHITDLSWTRIKSCDNFLKLNQNIKVIVLDFDDDKKRIALGFKQLQPNPWDSLGPNLNIGDKVSGKVLKIFDYGAFIELASGVEGLIHVSEMSWSQHLRSAHDFLAIGDTVEAVILTLDHEDRKISLGIKKSISDSWNDIEAKYEVGSKHSVKARHLADFGVFVELEEGVDGLIHISDLSWKKKLEHPSEFCKKGDNMQVVVLKMDRENKMVSLGHKQLEENSWDIFKATFTDGSIHEGRIIKILEQGTGIVSLPYGFEGICPFRHMKKVDDSKAQVEETLNFKVIEFNKEAEKIIVSHTSTFEEVEDRPSSTAKSRATAKKSIAPKKVAALSSDQIVNQIKTTLGDFDALTKLKEKMEKGEEMK